MQSLKALLEQPVVARLLTFALGGLALYAALYLFRFSREIGQEERATVTQRPSSIHQIIPGWVYRVQAVGLGVMMLLLAAAFLTGAILGKRFAPSIPW